MRILVKFHSELYRLVLENLEEYEWPGFRANNPLLEVRIIPLAKPRSQELVLARLEELTVVRTGYHPPAAAGEPL